MPRRGKERRESARGRERRVGTEGKRERGAREGGRTRRWGGARGWARLSWREGGQNARG